jgi:7-cyano-7-deazaguanine synthase
MVNGEILRTLGVRPDAPIAVLLSGGLDSAILAAVLAREGVRVQPIYIRTDAVWAPEEEEACRNFLEASGQNYAPLVRLAMPLADLYTQHWSITGEATPDASTPDDAVYLPGRNALLLVKAIVWCQIAGVEQLALAPLASNPFDDARPEFFQHFETSMANGYGRRVSLLRPFARLHKEEVMRLGRGLPLELTFSCIAPRDGLHCGICNKCHERKEAFRAADIPDQTRYA